MAIHPPLNTNIFSFIFIMIFWVYWEAYPDHKYFLFRWRKLWLVILVTFCCLNSDQVTKKWLFTNPALASGNGGGCEARRVTIFKDCATAKKITSSSWARTCSNFRCSLSVFHGVCEFMFFNCLANNNVLLRGLEGFGCMVVGKEEAQYDRRHTSNRFLLA